ncbi:flagellar motor protein PomA [Pelagibaculum spongiae]|uniref:Flagellar motor protein PomA n=1 Tax=Pelagibaculum spongiae TaxID=2080658 RepID=A0A2V1H518_9GAMM|nr:flagellar motor protein PomA [Pelagibaculum spongiae]PVZ71502.1 flagellar motor protein PomA [Pelagibaculum spongiae]
MDLATLIGLIGAFGIVGAAIVVGGSATIFINVPSILIVLLGSLMVVLMKYSIGQFVNTAKVIGKAFSNKQQAPLELITQAIELADLSRKEGVLALENATVENPFMARGVQMLVDGREADEIRSLLAKDMNLNIERHEIGQGLLRALGDVGPAMGMIGTLVGLVQMLSAMDDPKSIGPSMAVALLTTLYGAVLANMFALPLADKLELRANEERQSKALIIDALVGIQAGMNPRVLEEGLKNYLPNSKRASSN